MEIEVPFHRADLYAMADSASSNNNTFTPLSGILDVWVQHGEMVTVKSYSIESTRPLAL